MISALRNSFLKSLLATCLCLSVSTAWSRNYLPFRGYSNGDTHIGFIVRNDFLPNNTFKTYGLRVQYPLNEHWYLDYDYHFIVAGNGLHFSHMPLCAMGVKYLLLYTPMINDGWAYSALLMMVIPEGVSYKINPGKKIQYIPYFNPLGLDRLVFEREGQAVKKPWGFACNMGLEIQSDLPGNFYAAADAGITYNYASAKTAFGAGITIGIKR